MSRLARAALGAALISPGLIPILAPYLPFQDWPAHMGVIGALLHRDEPAARISEFYAYTGGLKPNAAFYWLAWLFARVLSPLSAANLALALSLAALGPSMLVLCRAAGTDERAALLALPLALGRHVYCGFAPNAAALPFFALSIAAYLALRRGPRLGLAMALGLLLLATHAMHAFVYLATAGLVLFGAALDLARGPRRAGLFALAATLASGLGFLPHLLRMEARADGGPGALGAIVAAALSADRGGLLGTFWEWLFASYRYARADDVGQAAWALLLVAALPLGRRAAGRLLPLAALTALMFALLPSYVGPPLSWWGGNLRLPVMAALLLVPLAGPAFARSRIYAGSAAALAVLLVGLATFDLARFSRTEMAGFGEVLDAIPPGRRISALHWTPHRVHEYPGEPHGYVSNYYLLEKGGFVPQNVFEHPDVPFARKAHGAAPPWGQAEYFDWYRYGPGWDGFLVRVHPDYEHSPLHGENQSRVRLVKAAGNWRYYEAESGTP